MSSVSKTTRKIAITAAKPRGVLGIPKGVGEDFIVDRGHDLKRLKTAVHPKLKSRARDYTKGKLGIPTKDGF